MRSHRVATLTGCLLWALSSAGHAQQTDTELTAATDSNASAKTGAGNNSREESDSDPEIGLVRKSINYVEDSQRVASERFGGFMTQVDGFFSDSTTEGALNNSSYARIRLDANRPGGQDFSFKPSLKLRVELPNTERRFKLLLSTEEDDTSIVGEGAERTQDAPSSSDSNASAAIRFARSARENGSVNLDLGVRQRDGDIQYFGRLNIGYRTTLARKWDFRASNSYWHYNKSGFENRLSFDFTRQLFYQDDLYIGAFSEIDWRKGNRGAILSQALGLYKHFDDTKTRALALEALAGYHTALNGDIADRYRGHEIRVRWRHNVWRPWFFYEIWPSVSWPASTDYNRSYGFLARIEVVIGQR